MMSMWLWKGLREGRLALSEWILGQGAVLAAYNSVTEGMRAVRRIKSASAEGEELVCVVINRRCCAGDGGNMCPRFVSGLDEVYEAIESAKIEPEKDDEEEEGGWTTDGPNPEEGLRSGSPSH